MFVATGRKKSATQIEEMQNQIKNLGETVTGLQTKIGEKDKQIEDLQILVATAVAPAPEGGAV